MALFYLAVSLAPLDERPEKFSYPSSAMFKDERQHMFRLRSRAVLRWKNLRTSILFKIRTRGPRMFGSGHTQAARISPRRRVPRPPA